MCHSFCIVFRNFLIARISLFFYKFEAIHGFSQSLSKGSSVNTKYGAILTLTRMCNRIRECTMILFGFSSKYGLIDQESKSENNPIKMILMFQIKWWEFHWDKATSVLPPLFLSKWAKSIKLAMQHGFVWSMIMPLITMIIIIMIFSCPDESLTAQYVTLSLTHCTMR